MFCDGKCDGCGLLTTVTMINEKGETKEDKTCVFQFLLMELTEVRQRLLGVQQATESLRNNDAKIGIAAVNAIDKGFKRMAKVALLKEQPALAILDDE